jgi:hypothetical protein
MCSALMINSSTQRYSSFLVAGDAHENPPVRESTSGFSFPNVIRGPGLMRTATNDSSAESKFRLSGPRREARRRRVLAMADGHDDDECRDRPRARDKIAGGAACNYGAVTVIPQRETAGAITTTERRCAQGAAPGGTSSFC